VTVSIVVATVQTKKNICVTVTLVILITYMEMKMSKTIYLHLEPHMISPESGATVQVKLDDEGIVIDAWSLDDCIASTWETYNELGVEVKEIEDELNE